MNTTATVSAKVLANRAATRNKMQARYAAVAAAMTTVSAIEYGTDEYGRKERLTPSSDADIAFCLRGNRVIDSVDMVEQIGAQAMSRLIQNGSIRRGADHSRKSICNLYWITDKAAELYGIPAQWSNALGTFRLVKAA